MWEDKVIEMRPGKEYHSIAAIMRCKPPHKGHMSFLEELCKRSEKVVIGIGSANKLDVSNPFFAVETEIMLDSVLSENYDNYEFVHIPDFASDEAWVKYVKQDNKLGKVQAIVSGNPWVQEVLGNEGYKILSSYEFAPGEETKGIHATQVRDLIAKDGAWEQYVPAKVAEYIKENGCVERIKAFYNILEKKQAA